MLDYENGNWKYAYVWKWQLQVCFTRKMETASMLTMKIETASMLNYENRTCKYA